MIGGHVPPLSCVARVGATPIRRRAARRRRARPATAASWAAAPATRPAAAWVHARGTSQIGPAGACPNWDTCQLHVCELHYFVEKTNDPMTLEVTSYMNDGPQRAFASANADWASA